mmetsp:Transcript_21297/g.81283  ORF Transcript_21297/g.81283 Transcript_21297/m.81283 type:complete len:249 (+) Transcript_21297:166-912(+)
MRPDEAVLLVRSQHGHGGLAAGGKRAAHHSSFQRRLPHGHLQDLTPPETQAGGEPPELGIGLRTGVSRLDAAHVTRAEADPAPRDVEADRPCVLGPGRSRDAHIGSHHRLHCPPCASDARRSRCALRLAACGGGRPASRDSRCLRHGHSGRGSRSRGHALKLPIFGGPVRHCRRESRQKAAGKRRVGIQCGSAELTANAKPGGEGAGPVEAAGLCCCRCESLLPRRGEEPGDGSGPQRIAQPRIDVAL